MKKFIILLLFIPFISLLAQDKYLIYFKDKGPDALLKETGASYREALREISPRAIERRKKVMNEDSIITFEDLPVNADYVNQLLTLGIKIENKLNWFNAVSAYLDNEMKVLVEKLPFVRTVEPVRILKFRNDIAKDNFLPKTTQSGAPDYGDSYTQLALSDVPVVHSKGITGNGIIIGVLDTGFDWKQHDALKNINVLAEYDFVFHDSVTANQSNDVPGQDSHGTFVFSVIGGYKDSTLIGSAYGSSYILAKTEDIRSETHVEEDNYAAALEWMEGMGVDVTSSSLGYNEFDPGTYSYTYADMNGKTTIITKAAELAFQRGVVTITAAGNEGNKPWHYIIAPADGFNTMAVGAVYSDNILAAFSSRGPTYDGRIKPDVLAMGVDVFGASSNGPDLYTYGTGTSAATPIAGGIAALLLSAYPHLTNVQVRDILHETSDNAEFPDNNRGYGLVSAAKAISFPNLQEVNGNYVIYKAFIDSFSVNDVQLHYSTDNNNFNELNMNVENDYSYRVQLPLFNFLQEVDFYFTYKDEAGNSYNDPADKYYSLRYGGLTVSLNIPLTSINYTLSNNYPNPFNSTTSIDFIAEGNFPAELTIYDVIGRKIRTLFNGITRTGVNHNIWDGKNDSGYDTASGIYIYTLVLNGSLYSKKMVYLK
jgi:serine protease AprX